MVNLDMHNPNRKSRSLLCALGSAALSIPLAPLSLASENVFELNELPAGYQLAQATPQIMPEGKCGEGKCGAGMMDSKAMPEGKCGEGKCGAGMMDVKPCQRASVVRVSVAPA